jgi:hypothetical protein
LISAPQAEPVFLGSFDQLEDHGRPSNSQVRIWSERFRGSDF